LANNLYTIGVTGHRHIPPERLPTLTEEIRKFYGEEIERHGNEGVAVLSSLAEGADTLCAKLALDAGMRLIVPLPMAVLDYRGDFSGPAASEFDWLLSLADQVFVAPPEEPVPANPPRGFHYRQAGIYVTKHCDILLAVWDRVERNTPDGAGTWETMKLARKFEVPIRLMMV